VRIPGTSLDDLVNHPKEYKVPTDETKQWGIIAESYALRVNKDRVFVKEDPYKSKYDCIECGGAGHLGVICKYCKGTKYEKGKEENGYCRDCTVGKGGLGKTLGYEACPSCKGQGGLISVPDESKRMTTTGDILAIGPLVKNFKVGQKVMFTNYTGTPFEFMDIKFRMMHEDDVLGEVRQLKKGVDGLTSGSFADLENAGVAHGE
jgi:co-chaperonin GroES (HSP10)